MTLKEKVRAGDGKRASAAEPAEHAVEVSAVGVGLDEDGDDGVGGGVGAGGGVDDGVGGGEEGVGEEVGGHGGVAGRGGGVESGGLGGCPSEEGDGDERVGWLRMTWATSVGERCWTKCARELSSTGGLKVWSAAATSVDAGAVPGLQSPRTHPM